MLSVVRLGGIALTAWLRPADFMLYKSFGAMEKRLTKAKAQNFYDGRGGTCLIALISQHLNEHKDKGVALFMLPSETFKK